MDYQEKYLYRAKVAGRILRWVPFLRMAGLNGSIVRGEETEESDIDFLIIAKAGRLYTTRFFATIFVHLTGWRRSGDKIAGRICLNCYLSDKKLDISPRDSRSRAKVARAYKYLIPLTDANYTVREFFRTNGWMDLEPSVVGRQSSVVKYNSKLQKKLIPNGSKKPIRFLEIYLKGKFGNLIEKKLMNYQVKRIVTGKKRGDETIATKYEIRLHPRKQ